MTVHTAVTGISLLCGILKLCVSSIIYPFPSCRLLVFKKFEGQLFVYLNWLKTPISCILYTVLAVYFCLIWMFLNTILWRIYIPITFGAQRAIASQPPTIAQHSLVLTDYTGGRIF